MVTCANPIYLYLLHFDAPVGPARHYLGSTTRRQLGERLRRHLAGTGSHLTRALAAQGAGFTLVRLIPIENRSEEARIKDIGHYASRCPICSKTPRTQALYPGAAHFPPLQPFLPFGVNWTETPATGSDPRHRKGRPAGAKTVPSVSLVQK